jgi:predicted phage terminase large subunit-like protein
MQIQARRSYWAFRQYVHPDLIIGWWQREIAEELQTFYEDLIAGKRPKLLIQAPPQHGKSMQIVDFIAWVCGKHPELKVIYASVSERLGIRANLELQRMFDKQKYKATFPSTRISEKNSVTISQQSLRNREILEFVGMGGYFRNVTVNGSVNGEGLDLGVLDDPIKDRAEANSKVIRDRTYDWLTDVFLPRSSKKAGLLGIMTRWHVDDPFGRMQKNMNNIKVVKHPAIAEHDEAHRSAGEALFPEHKPIDFLNEIKSGMAQASWEALYQQNPVITGGNIFKDAWWSYYRVPPAIEWRQIYADTAQKTKQINDYSVMQCWGRSRSGQAVLLDQIRGKWEAPELLTHARAFWAKHRDVVGMGTLRAFKVEDKVSGTGLIQTLKREGLPMIGIQRNIDKVTRAYDAAPFIESGNVLLPEQASWLSDYLSEFPAFPDGAHDDQVDPTIDAIVDILQGSAVTPQIRAL